MGKKNIVALIGLTVSAFAAGCALTPPDAPAPYHQVFAARPGQGPAADEMKPFEPGDSLVLEGLLRTAEENSAELRSVHTKWKAAVERVPQASSLPDPRLTYGYFTEEVQTKTGPQVQRVSVSQTLPWFGKLSLKEKIAALEAEAVFLEYQSRRLTLVKEIKRVFYEYGYLRQAIDLNREHLELLRGMEDIASIRFKFSKLPQNVLIQLQVEQGKLEDRIRELESLRKALSSELRALLSLADGSLFPWPEKDPDRSPTLNLEDIENRLEVNNPDLQRLELLTEREAFSAEIARKDFYPDVTFGVEHTDVDGGRNPTALTVSVNLPVWHDRIRASVKEAENRRKSIAEQKRSSGYTLQAKFDLLAYYFSDAKRKAHFYESALIPKAKQAIDIAMKGFETGSVSYSDLLDAERTLLEFQLTSARQLANARIKAAELNALVTYPETEKLQGEQP